MLALLLMQGFNRVTAVSVLISGQALFEIAGTVLVFKGGFGVHESQLCNMGLVTLLSACLAACVGSPLLTPIPDQMQITFQLDWLPNIPSLLMHRSCYILYLHTFAVLKQH